MTRFLSLLVVLSVVLAGCGSDPVANNSDDQSGGDTGGHNDMRSDQQDLKQGDAVTKDELHGDAPDDSGDLTDVAADNETDTGIPDVAPDMDTSKDEDSGDEPDSDDITADVEVVVPPCESGKQCDDLNACTLNDFCVDSVCKGTPKDCSDGLECTWDLCDKGECSNEMKPGYCFIWEQCWADGEVNPSSPCLECISSYRVYTWSSDDTNECDDGDPCTVADHCSDGECNGGAMACDDGNPCTLDVCSGGQCENLEQTGPECDDENVCTLNDYCDAGQCVGGDDIRQCDDFNPCTLEECDPVMGCVYKPKTGFCEDGNACTTGDKCISGVCIPGLPLVCNDDNLCTTDVCNPLVGCKFINNALPCDDNDPCSVGDKCLGGTCKKGPDLLDCEDTNTCTMEWCAPFVGCQHAPIPGALCSDGNTCTYGDHCDGSECVFETKVECYDGNPCTNDVCDGAFGCAFINNSHPCDDGNKCTAGDQCIEGECHTGLLPVDCFKDNPCATGECVPEDGCVMVPLDGKECNDGDACTIGDVCVAGECLRGDLELSCNDGNVCTIDWCDQIHGCLHEPVESVCDDFNICTASDKCMDGECKGTPISCNDGNACTMDSCDPSQGCQYSVLVTEFCQPKLIIDYPARAAELTGPNTNITAYGHVVTNAAPVAWVKINGTTVIPSAGGTFSITLPSVQGVNLIEGELFDQYDGKDKLVQSYLLTNKYIAMNYDNPVVSKIDPALKIFLGQNVWDDNDSSPNDFASLVTLFFDSLDVNGMLPPYFIQNGDYDVYSDSGILYDEIIVDLTCMNGFLRITATLPNIYIHINADSKHWYLPDISGKATADSVTIVIDVVFTVDADGNVTAEMGAVDTTVHNLDVDIDDFWGFLLNWLVDFFEGTFEGLIEDQLQSTVYEQVPPILESAMEQLAFTTEFELPAVLGGDPINLTLDTRVTNIEFYVGGSEVSLGGAVVVPKGTTVESKGSVTHSACLVGEPAFEFVGPEEIKLGINDDFLNQLVYAIFWSGMLEMDLGTELLGGGDFSDFGIEDMSIKAKALRAPVITDCGSGNLTVTLADLEITADMNMFGAPTHVVMYGAFRAGLQVSVGPVNGGPNQLSLGVTEIEWVKLEIATVSENLVGAEDGLRIIIRDQLLPILTGQITDNLMATIPIPEIDLTGMVPQLGSVSVILKMTPQSAGRNRGFTVVGGTVHE